MLYLVSVTLISLGLGFMGYMFFGPLAGLFMGAAVVVIMLYRYMMIVRETPEDRELVARMRKSRANSKSEG